MGGMPLSQKQEIRLCGSVVFALVGAAVFSTGVYYLADVTTGLHAAAVHNYTVAAQEWTNTKRGVFDATAFTATITVGGVTVSDAALEPDVEPDPVPEGVATPYYLPLKHELPLAAAKRLPSVNYTLTQHMALTVTTSLPPSGSQHTLPLPHVPLFKSSEVYIPKSTATGATRCMNNMHGVYDATTKRCFVLYQLSSVCFQLLPDQSAAGRWRLNTDRGAGGCNSPTDEWQPGQYTKMVLHPGGSLTPPASFSALSVTLRSSADPYVVAEDVTHGSMDFGMTERQSVVTGLVLLVVAALICVNPVLTCISLRKQYHLWHGQMKEPSFLTLGPGALNNTRHAGGMPFHDDDVADHIHVDHNGADDFLQDFGMDSDDGMDDGAGAGGDHSQAVHTTLSPSRATRRRSSPKQA